MMNIDTQKEIVNSKLDYLNKLGLRDTFQRITLSWENINVFATSNSCLKKSKEKTHILHDVDGIAKPGELLAIMGASGSGKTTLLNVLNYRNKGTLEVSGDIRVNGQSISSALTLSSISGYVQQEDLFIGTLTVKEHLKFQAMLKMRNKSYEEKIARVYEVINDLNLKKCENTLIGIETKNVKGISGGEKRRLAFATEIITNPGLLFCDEPTSGLDSFMAQTVVESMENLAKQGKTIICIIHQPSSDIFEKFDKLYLLAEGRLAFYGDLIKAQNFFESQGLILPKNYNPADFYIQNLAISPFDRETSINRVQKICDGFSNSSFKNDLKEEINEARTQSLKYDINMFLNDTTSYTSNSFSQIKWLLWRNFLATLRDPLATKIQIIQVIMIAIVFGLIFLQQTLDQVSVQNINGVLFLCITNTTFSNLFAVLNNFPGELPVFLRENYNRMYRVGNYYISKILADQLSFIILPFIFITIVYWMSNLNDEIYRFFICAATIIFVANVSVAFGTLVSSIAPSVNVATAIAGPVITPLMIFGGSFLNNESIPEYFYWLKYLSWLGYANEILNVNQWEGLDIRCNNATTCKFKTGDDVLKEFNFNKENFKLDFILIGVLYLTWRILTYFFLLRKSYSYK